MTVSNLVIFVSNYPYGEGEPFLEEELIVLANQFETIYIVRTDENESVDDCYFIPPNCKVLTISDRKSKFNFLYSFFFAPMYELLLAKFKHKIKFTFELLRLVFGYWSKSKRLEKAIWSLIANEQIDVTSTMFYTYWCDSATIALANMHKKKAAINFVTRLHGWDLYFTRHSIRFLPFRERIANEAAFLTPISNDGKKYLLDQKISRKPQRIVTSRLGVKKINLNPFYQGSANNEFFHIVTISHINPVKSLYRLAEAIAKIDDFEIMWTHIGYGDGVFDLAFMQDVAALLDIKPNVTYRFTGKYSKEEVFNFLEHVPVDCIVNCSTTEGIPVSLMETMSAGIPAIAINVGGIPEIVKDGFNGILLDNKDDDIIDTLSKAIVSFQSLTFGEKKTLSQNAVSSWEKKYNSQINFFNFAQLLKGKSCKETIYESCDKCLIDSDVYPSMVLDKYGVCDICRIIIDKNEKLAVQQESGYLDKLLKDIHSSKNKKEYDCIIGISGGVDSSYLAYMAKEWGLNPLLVHVDTGWNSEMAVVNIKLLIDYLGFDLYTVVVDWNEIQDIVRSFMKASVIDIDWANELSAQASLYKVAQKFKIKHILTGHQVATEGWMPINIVHYKLDLINFKAIHRKFGERKLKTYPTIGVMKTYFYEKVVKIKYYNPMDFIPYVKDDVKLLLIEKYGYRDHGHKHYENIFTRFYQGYILPHKFKVDKRVFHYSSLIVAGQISKKDAEAELKKDPYMDANQFSLDKEFVMKKLGFLEEDFDRILKENPKNHTDYPSYLNLTNGVRKIWWKIQNNK